MAIKEVILATTLSLTSPEVWVDKTNPVKVQLNAQKNIIKKVIESKKNPKIIDEKLMKKAMQIANNNPIKFDFKTAPHYAKLSPELQKHFFSWNRVDYPKINLTWEIIRNAPKPKYEWNLQYLVWETWMWTYLTLSKEHQKVIQDLANILLTDEYAKNIEENAKIDWDNYIIIDWDLDTFSLSDFLERSIYILRWIQWVERWIDENYNVLLKDLKKYSKYKNIKQFYDKLLTFKPKIEAIKEIFKNLDKQNYKNEMDFRKREAIIKQELKKVEEELKKKYGIIVWLQGEVKWLQGEVQWLQEEIRKKLEYIKTLKRLHGLIWISQ